MRTHPMNIVELYIIQLILLLKKYVYIYVGICTESEPLLFQVFFRIDVP